MGAARGGVPNSLSGAAVTGRARAGTGAQGGAGRWAAPVAPRLGSSQQVQVHNLGFGCATRESTEEGVSEPEVGAAAGLEALGLFGSLGRTVRVMLWRVDKDPSWLCSSCAG